MVNQEVSLMEDLVELLKVHLMVVLLLEHLEVEDLMGDQVRHHELIMMYLILN